MVYIDPRLDGRKGGKKKVTLQKGKVNARTVTDAGT